MSYLRNIYEKLKCKQCKKTFCCTVCRRQHEEHVHSILEECDVCQSGAILISKTKKSDTLLRHLQEKHWPLHCVHCDEVYSTGAALSDGNCKCRGPKRTATKIELEMTTNESKDMEFDSPDSRNMNPNIFSSTPMNEQVKNGFKLLENITPVDAEKSQDVPVGDSGSGHIESNNSMKSTRKVTFLTTPALENIRRKPKNHENFLKVSLKNSMRLSHTESSSKITTSQSIASQASEKSNYVTAADKVPSEKDAKRTTPSIPGKSLATIKKRRSRSMNETLWLSAINESFALQDISNSPDEKRRLSVTLSSMEQSCTPKPLQAGSRPSHAATHCPTSSKKTGVWSSMTSLLRNVVHGFGAPHHPDEPSSSKAMKRPRSQADREDGPEVDERVALKRMKLCDIKCRRPIRAHSRIVPKKDKSIQTDEDEYFA